MSEPPHIPSRPGTHRLPCPDCNKGKRDDALAVTVEQDGGAVWYCHRCGLRGGSRGERIEGRGRPNQPTAPKPPKPDRSADALELWHSRVPVDGTPAETYLRGRKLDPALLATDPPGWPETLGWHGDADGYGNGALLVAVNDATHGCVRAVQRVFLRADGTAQRKPNGDKRKMALGPLKGNAARLSCWPHPDGWWGLAEGAETALAARQLLGVPVWAAISAGNMPNVRPPHWARHTILFADNDDSGTGLEQAAKARAALPPHIQTARVVMAEQLGQDAADILQEVV
jgi:hypothetical protein